MTNAHTSCLFITLLIALAGCVTSDPEISGGPPAGATDAQALLDAYTEG